jgi:hypothetical protein
MKNILAIAFVAIILGAIASSFSSGIAAPPYYYNRTGAGSSTSNCAGSGCHNANTSDLYLNMLLINLVTGDTVKGFTKQYTPNTPYKIKVIGQLQNSGYPIFSYQFAGQKTDGTVAGTYFSTPGLQANYVSLLEIVEPVQPRITTGLRCVDSINWIAPQKGSGHVTLFLTMLAANANTLSSGDVTNNDSFSFDEGPTSIDDFSTNVENLVYPNPARDEVTFSIDRVEKGNYSVMLMNQFGSVVKQEMLSIENESSKTTIDLKGYSPGIYWLNFSKQGKQRTLHFLKL